MGNALIALSGNSIQRGTLDAAFNFCAEMHCAAHILLVDAKGAPPPALKGFLDQMKQAGLEFRLFRHAGALDRAVMDHTHAHRDIDVILVDDMKHGGPGVPFMALTQPVGLLGGEMAT
jgi:hypothetical protein